MRALLGAAIGLSLILGITIESTHVHAVTDLSAVCSVCKLSHHGTQPSDPGTLVIIAAGLVSASALPGHRLIPGIVNLSPHRSRAPPLAISP